VRQPHPKLAYISIAFAAAATTTLTWLVEMLVERGLYADEHHTSGYTSVTEISIGIVSLLIFFCAIFSLFRLFRKDKLRKDGKLDKDYELLKNLSLVSLLVSGVSPIAFWFSIAALACGFMTIISSFFVEGADKERLQVYRVIGAIGITIASINLFLAFSR
jgi:hypothetical protein